MLQENDEVKKQMDIFIPKSDNVKVHLITIENLNSEESKQIDISYSIDPVFGTTKEKTKDFVIKRVVNDSILEIKNPYCNYFSKCLGYVTVNSLNSNINVLVDKDNYSVNVKAKINPSSKLKFVILFGAEENTEKIKDIISKYSTLDAVINEYNNTKDFWKEKVKRNFNTSNKYLDIMANGWLLYQAIVSRLYSKTGFYQAGGAIGFRDQLQDSMALISHWPEKTREQIILHSSKQFKKGDVLHWWHEHNNAGIRTYFSDDYLWLPYVLEEYVTKTQDYSILEVKTKYLQDKPMGNLRELYDVYEYSDEEDSVYNHAKKAIMYSLSRINEKNGLLDIGDGDWNDGFSNIRGQSVWLTFFVMNILDRFETLAKHVNDVEMIKLCKAKRHFLKHSIVDNAWDKDHFVRAYFENGEVLGAYSNDECKIDLISQAWAVISMINDSDIQSELKECLKSADKYLVDRENMIVKLLYPAFDKPKNNPGYIKAYLPGIRENGGQYTHGATWLAKAYFEMGKEKEAIEILNMLNPISHSDSKDKADVYMVEPYVIAADIYSNEEHLGRGGWTWYTGSASWMYKIIEDYLKES